jgi:phytoene dehydrogenase-like protein
MTSQQYDVLVLGSGAGGKLLSWHKARAGRRTAVVERKWIGGSCPNIVLAGRAVGSGVPKWPISSTTRRRSG